MRKIIKFTHRPILFMRKIIRFTHRTNTFMRKSDSDCMRMRRDATAIIIESVSDDGEENVGGVCGCQMKTPGYLVREGLT